MWRATILMFAMVASGARPMPSNAASDVPLGVAGQIAKVLPGVVNIKTVTTRHGAPYYSWGSGFVVAASGMIVTNRHVVADAKQITVTGIDISAERATVVFVSSLLDLAVLKIDAGKDLPVLQFADSDKVQVADPVFAIGSPLGIGLSVSAGIVSALNRNIRETNYDDFIQTDAAINHGSSGGPLVNPSGDVVGMDTALDSSPNNTGSIGIGFAMPANDVKFVVDQVLKYGRERAGWAGLHLQRVNEDLAEAFMIGEPRGVLVTAVDQAAPASGRIQVGDIIMTIGGQQALGGRQVQRIIAESPINQPVSVSLLRNGVAETATLTIAEYPADRKAATTQALPPMKSRIALAGPGHLGMRLIKLTIAARQQHDLASGEKGVLVAEVDPFGAAGNGGIMPGDVILRVGLDPVQVPADVTQRLQALSRKKTAAAALLVLGTSGSHWVALQLDTEE